MKLPGQISLVLISILILIGCAGKKEPAKPVSPVKQTNPTKEGDLNTLHLTSDAVKRIGITVSEAGNGDASQIRAYTGELMTVPGGTITITAPVAGTLLSASGTNPQAGQEIRKGSTMYRLMILPSEKDLISAKEDVGQKQVQLDVVKQKLARAKTLLEEKAGSLRAVQEAEAELAGVEASLNVAKARLELLKGNSSAHLANTLSTLTIDAPVSGRIQRLFSSPSQIVSAAAPIAEIAATDLLWIRVPVYAGDVERISSQNTANVQLLNNFGGGAESFTAYKVSGPQTADPLNTSVDLYYSITNSNNRFRPGERVSVSLPMKGSSKSITLPFSSIAYDIHGGSWVYIQTDSTSFQRRRVQIERVEKNVVYISLGLKGGEKVVTVGTAELFGTEFGGGK